MAEQLKFAEQASTTLDHGSFVSTRKLLHRFPLSTNFALRNPLVWPPQVVQHSEPVSKRHNEPFGV